MGGVAPVLMVKEVREGPPPDARGTERWYGEYPSMYLSTAGLIQQVRAHLAR